MVPGVTANLEERGTGRSPPQPALMPPRPRRRRAWPGRPRVPPVVEVGNHRRENEVELVRPAITSGETGDQVPLAEVDGCRDPTLGSTRTRRLGHDPFDRRSVGQ